jgi:hypothetical protein
LALYPSPSAAAGRSAIARQSELRQHAAKNYAIFSMIALPRLLEPMVNPPHHTDDDQQRSEDRQTDAAMNICATRSNESWLDQRNRKPQGQYDSVQFRARRLLLSTGAGSTLSAVIRQVAR